MKFGIGQPITRKEDVRFLTGGGKFIDDHAPKACLMGYVLRAPIAHGVLRNLDTTDALALPGVRVIYRFEDIADRLTPLACRVPMKQSDGSAFVDIKQPQLSDGRIRYVGEPIAFVVADSLNTARDAAELITFDLEDLPVVVDGPAALSADAPQLHDSAPGNLSYDWHIGDSEKTAEAFARADHISRVTVVNQRISVTAMETRGIVIQYHGETDRWEGWVGSQGAHAMRGGIAAALGVEPTRLRIHAPDIGGGFGMKIMQHPEYGLAALAAKDTGMPVKWIGDRSESFLSDAQARDLQTEVEGAFTTDGTLLALRSDSVSNLGAYHSTVGPLIHTAFSAGLLGGMYRLSGFHARVRGALTNTTPTDAYRGAGRPEVIYCTERLMEQAAHDLGIAPDVLRRRNLLTPDEVPLTTMGGMTFDSLDPAALMDAAITAADVTGFDARRAEAEKSGKLRGLASIYYMERTGGAPDENAEISITADGHATIRVGTQSTGQGHETAWSQILTENLGLEWDKITLAPGDSDALPLGGGTGGSRSLIMASRTIQLAADDVIKKTLPAAADELEVAAEDVEFSPDLGAFVIAGTDRQVTLPAIIAKLGGVSGFGKVGDMHNSFPNGCHVAEVEIDQSTGRVTLDRYTMADDFGVIINPILAGGQAQGGVAQGVGQALMEHGVYDPESGQPMAASFMDYTVPRASDLPMLEPHFVEVPCTTNPYGVKGGGESGTVASIPATALAVQDAIRNAGGDVIEPPFTSERVWRALNS